MRRTPSWHSRLSESLLERLGPEEQALVFLANPVAPILPLLPVDPERLLGLIAEHGLAGRMVARGRQLLAAGVPAAWLGRWRDGNRAQAARMLLLVNEESRVQELLASEGISSIPLKGATLARLLYDDPTARPATDIDLGLRAGDVPLAARLLAAEGYACSTAMAVLSHRSFLEHAGEHTSEAIFSRERAGVPLMVELHWNLLLLPDREIWETLREYRAARDGTTVRTLSPTLYFLYLCAHVSGHGWMGLRWLVDAGDFLSRYAADLDSGEFLRLAAVARLRIRVGVTLLLLDAYFGLRWPPGESLANERARHLAARYLLRPISTSLDQGAGAIHSERLRVADNWPDRVRYLAWLARPTRVEYDRGGAVRSWPAAWVLRAARLAALAWRAGLGGRAEA